MKECICSSCKNLKGIIEDNSEAGFFECEFGYPSENCENCEENECDVECAHYISDESEVPVQVKCKKCGKELEKAFDDGDDGDVFCINCYLSDMNS